MNGLDREDRAYRRGVVFGWSLAEVFLLVMFALLFAIASLLASIQAKKPKPGVQASVSVKSLAPEPPPAGKAPRFVPKNEFDNLFRELQLAKDKILALVEEKERLLQEIAGLRRQLEQLKNELADAQKQKAYFVEKQARFGGGADYPPCWFKDGTTKAEYIFDIGLTSKGIVVHRNPLTGHEQGIDQLQLDRITFDKEIDDSVFEQQTDALFNYSKERSCRFYVTVFDQTKADEKEIYKQHLRAVERHFYEFEPLSVDPAPASSGSIGR